MYQQPLICKPIKPIKTEPFITFCQTDDFKKYVRTAVNDQIFWNNLIQEMNINTYIKNEINERVPDKVKIEVNRLVPDKIEKALTQFERYRIPECVSDQLKKQVSDYLNNDYKMQQLMSAHSSKLEEELQNKAKQILDKVTNEEQYHTVTNAHLDNMKNRWERTMNEQVVLNNHLCQETIKNVHNQVNNELGLAKECIKTVNDLETQVNQLKRDNNIYWFLTFVSMSIATVTGGFIIYNQYAYS